MDIDKIDITVRLRDLVAELDRSPLGQQLRDPQFRRRHAAEALLRSSDPVMREIGEQLRDDRIRPRDILGVPAYLEAFQRSAQRSEQRLDAREIAAQLESLLATQPADTERRTPGDRADANERDGWDR